MSAGARALLDSGLKLPLTFCSAAPLACWVKPPACSPSLTVAAAPPVFLTVSFCVLAPPQATEAETEAGVMAT